MFTATKPGISSCARLAPATPRKRSARRLAAPAASSSAPRLPSRVLMADTAPVLQPTLCRGVQPRRRTAPALVNRAYSGIFPATPARSAAAPRPRNRGAKTVLATLPETQNDRPSYIHTHEAGFSARSKRFEALAKRPVNQDGFVKEWIEERLVT